MTTSLLEHAEYAPLFHSCEVIQGRDNALMQQVFELRFQIYCLERHDYRRRRDSRPAGVTAGQACAVSPGVRRDDAAQVLLTLYRQMYAYSRANDISHWYAAMERPLARSLMRMNIAFRAIGPQTDYYGPVAPYLASLQEVEAQVKARDPGLFAWLQKAERRNVKPALVN